MQRLVDLVCRASWCLCVAAVWPGAVAAQTVAPVEFVLEDQFRNRHETARLRGDVVVLVYAERYGAEAAVEGMAHLNELHVYDLQGMHASLQ